MDPTVCRDGSRKHTSRLRDGKIGTQKKVPKTCKQAEWFWRLGAWIDSPALTATPLLLSDWSLPTVLVYFLHAVEAHRNLSQHEGGLGAASSTVIVGMSHEVDNGTLIEYLTGDQHSERSKRKEPNRGKKVHVLR